MMSKGAHKPYKWKVEVLAEVVKNSTSIEEVKRQLGVQDIGSIHKWIKKLELDTSHFLGFGAHSIRNALLDSEVFVINCTHIDVAKVRYYKRTPQICEICGQGPVWNGKPLRFQVDRINGNNKDCRWENLRKLCPNCHTQTETWGRKGKSSSPKCWNHPNNMMMKQKKLPTLLR